MYCPRCRTEYRSGFTVCADCHEALVQELPRERARPPRPERAQTLGDLVVVYEVSVPEAEMMRSVLEGSGIAAAVKSGQSGAYPVTVGDMGQGHVLVRRSDAQRAREVIETALEGELRLQEDQ